LGVYTLGLKSHLEVFLVHPGGPFWANKDLGVTVAYFCSGAHTCTGLSSGKLRANDIQSKRGDCSRSRSRKLLKSMPTKRNRCAGPRSMRPRRERAIAVSSSRDSGGTPGVWLRVRRLKSLVFSLRTTVRATPHYHDRPPSSEENLSSFGESPLWSCRLAPQIPTLWRSGQHFDGGRLLIPFIGTCRGSRDGSFGLHSQASFNTGSADAV
jgi:hypothetical protein